MHNFTFDKISLNYNGLFQSGVAKLPARLYQSTCTVKNRGGSRAVVKSKMECFVIIANKAKYPISVFSTKKTLKVVDFLLIEENFCLNL